MHRTGKGRHLFYRSAEVNGTKPKSLRTSLEMPYRQQKNRARKTSLLGSQFVYMGVLSDDFAAVDVREELCYHSRPKKTNLRGALSGHETNGRKLCAAGNTEPIPKRFSGDGSAPPRFLVAVNFAFRRLAKATRQLCSVTAPLPKKFCDTFWEPCFTWFFGHFSVCFSVACAWLRRAKRAALVYDKHTPRCQLSFYFILFYAILTCFRSVQR